MRASIAALVVLSATTVLGAHAALPMPPGWRPPNDSELAYDHPFRGESSSRYLVVTGDFNGDGVVDEARLLVSTTRKMYGLVISFGGRQAADMHLMLERGPISTLSILGIGEFPQGKHELICRGKEAGYDWCRPGEPTRLFLKNAGIERFFEGKSAYVYYVRGTHFHRLWVAD